MGVSILLGILLLIHPQIGFAHLSIIRQGAESAGVQGSNEYTGFSLAVGDFNGDMFDDLAMGAPGEIVGGLTSVGAIVVVYGSPTGLTHLGAQFLVPGAIGAPTTEGMSFGYALAAGDFGADGFDDLAVGAPFDTEGDSHGRVYVLPGSPGGLRPVLRDVLDQNGFLAAVAEVDDQFGWSLAVGNFDGDSGDSMGVDLAIGSPGEDFNRGAVFHVYGNRSLDESEGGFFTPVDLGGGALAGGRFGESLASGDLYGSTHGDLAVGAPLRMVSEFARAGAVFLIRGSANGLSTVDPGLYSADDWDEPEAFAHFGSALAVGRFSSDAYASLAMGEPGRTVSSDAGAGRVLAIPGSLAGLEWAAGSARVVLPTPTEPDERFGSALAAGNWDNDPTPYDDLAIGSPGENVTGATDDAGRLSVIPGSGTGLTISSMQTFTQLQAGDIAETDDTFAFALAFGAFDDTGREGLAVSAPGEDTSVDVSYDAEDVDLEETSAAGQVSVLMPWAQPSQPLRCRHSAVYDCENQLIFSQRPFDRVRVASTTKVMTVLLACERTQLPLNDPNYLGLDTEYSIPPWLDLSDGNMPVNTPLFREGQVWTLDGLIRLALYPSNNDAAYAIADLLTGGGHDWEGELDTVSEFVESMNVRANSLGMFATEFRNPAGLDWGDPYSTPADMARLARAAMENPVFRSVSLTTVKAVHYLDPGSAVQNPVLVLNGNYNLLNAVQNASGIKAGSTPAAGRTFLASAESPALGRVIATVFGWPSTAGRNGDLARLAGLGLASCGVSGAPDWPYAPSPAASAQTYLTLPNVATVAGKSRAGVLQTDVLEEESDLQVDVWRQTGTGLASVALRIGRGASLALAPSQEVSLGIAPFERHEGFIVTNADSESVHLHLSQNFPPSAGQVTLPPDGAVRIPPFSGPRAVEFRLIIRNPSNTDYALLDVQELGYGFTITTTGPPGSSIFTGVLRRQGDLLEDGLAVQIVGLDANPGGEVQLNVRTPGLVVGVEDPERLVGARPSIRLQPPRPNPFSGRTRIPLDLAQEGRVEVAFYDLQGRQVRRLLPLHRNPGPWEVEWDGCNDRGSRLSAGVYFARFSLDGEQAGVVKLVVLRP
ncbi:MAG: hypothetical protein ACREOU_12805 [Candidatus Eiseniibacteriota bacterium]